MVSSRGCERCVWKQPMTLKPNFFWVRIKFRGKADGPLWWSWCWPIQRSIKWWVFKGSQDGTHHLWRLSEDLKNYNEWKAKAWILAANRGKHWSRYHLRPSPTWPSWRVLPEIGLRCHKFDCFLWSSLRNGVRTDTPIVVFHRSWDFPIPNWISTIINYYLPAISVWFPLPIINTPRTLVQKVLVNLWVVHRIDYGWLWGWLDEIHSYTVDLIYGAPFCQYLYFVTDPC